jgi:hypothetical protein
MPATSTHAGSPDHDATQQTDAVSPRDALCGSHGADVGWTDATACERLLDFAERLTRTVAVARALIAGGRMIDLNGFEDGIGLLCAKALDLERAESRQVLPALLELLAQIDAVIGKMGCRQGHVSKAMFRNGR